MPTMDDPTTVVLTAANSQLHLNDSTDYQIVLTPGADEIPGGATIFGGHNIVIDGGDIDVPNAARGLELTGQTGTAWIHDLHISGPSLTEGIDLSEPLATVVMRDILIDTVHGSQTTNHADLVQTWNGPHRLLIDGLVGTTTYQGMFLLPNQFTPTAPAPSQIDLRHIEITDDGAYALWRAPGNPFPLNIEDVFVQPNPLSSWIGFWEWPKPDTGDTSWVGVGDGLPSGAAYVTATANGATGISDQETPAPLPSETGS
jgi:hypothetical protein